MFGMDLCAYLLVEPGGIEPPSFTAGAEPRYDHPLNTSHTANVMQGHVLFGTAGCFPVSAVFPTVNGLSCRHPPLLLPGCGGSAPCDITVHWCSRQRLGCENELLVGSYWFALFNESEQLGSRNAVRVKSKPVGPVGHHCHGPGRGRNPARRKPQKPRIRTRATSRQ